MTLEIQFLPWDRHKIYIQWLIKRRHFLSFYLNHIMLVLQWQLSLISDGHFETKQAWYIMGPSTDPIQSNVLLKKNIEFTHNLCLAFYFVHDCTCAAIINLRLLIMINKKEPLIDHSGPFQVICY